MIFDTHARNVCRKTGACLIHCSHTSQRIIVHCVAAWAQAATAKRHRAPLPPVPANMTDGRVPRDLIYWLAAWPQNVHRMGGWGGGGFVARFGRSDKTIVDGIGRMWVWECVCGLVCLQEGWLNSIRNARQFDEEFRMHLVPWDWSEWELQIQFHLLSIAKWKWLINDVFTPPVNVPLRLLFLFWSKNSTTEC